MDVYDGRNVSFKRMFLLVVASWMVVAGVVVKAQTKAPASAAAPAVTDWQTAAGGKMEFDVASVKENKRGFSPDNPQNRNFPWGSTPTYVPTGGLFVAKNVSLVDVIALAYKMTGQQITHMLLPALPNWTQTERFDIQARAPAGPEPTKDQMRLMVQALLADRFQLKLHYNTKEGTVYALRMVQPGELGPNLKRHPADVGCKTWIVFDRNSPVPEKPTDGLPAICSTVERMKSPPETLSYAGRGTAIGELVKMAVAWYDNGRPVLDETGLEGTYDFTLEFSPPADTPPPLPGANPDAPPRPAFINEHGAAGSELQQALRKQLGLKLDTTKGPVQTLVIDHIEHPSSN